MTGEVVWGHHTGVAEPADRNFSGNWTGTGTIQGSGDDETLILGEGGTEESETWELGAGEAEINLNTYKGGTGTPSVIKYKTGATEEDCDADSWHIYNNNSFTSLGWIKVRLEA